MSETEYPVPSHKAIQEMRDDLVEGMRRKFATSEYLIPEDLREDYESAVTERDNTERPEPWHDTMKTIAGYIERIARAEAHLKEAKAGWDSCIADLREAAEICRETEAQLGAANKRIAELERIIASIKLADDEKADSLNSYRVDLETAIEQRDEARKEVERLSTPVTDEEWEQQLLCHKDQPYTRRLYVDALLASRAQQPSADEKPQRGVKAMGSSCVCGHQHRSDGSCTVCVSCTSTPCNHERLNEDGICRRCGTDCRGIG